MNVAVVAYVERQFLDRFPDCVVEVSYDVDDGVWRVEVTPSCDITRHWTTKVGTDDPFFFVSGNEAWCFALPIELLK